MSDDSTRSGRSNSVMECDFLDVRKLSDYGVGHLSHALDVSLDDF